MAAAASSSSFSNMQCIGVATISALLHMFRTTYYTTVSRAIEWLSESGATSPKHSNGWAHPLAACLLHYVIVIPSTICLHDKLVATGILVFPSPEESVVSTIFASYATVLLIWRLVTIRKWLGPVHGRAVLYEFTWLCNSTLIMVAIGLRTHRPTLASAFCVAVSIDQLLWWVDLLGWLLSGFSHFPVGVCQYLTWPQTSWGTRITATHHLWTIPLTMYAVKGWHWTSYPLSIYIVSMHVLLSRWLTPFTIKCAPSDEKDQSRANDKYLNVNLAFELWKDITFPFLQINHDNPSTMLYLFRLLLRWNLLNFATFGLLLKVSS